MSDYGDDWDKYDYFDDLHDDDDGGYDYDDNFDDLHDDDDDDDYGDRTHNLLSSLGVDVERTLKVYTEIPPGKHTPYQGPGRKLGYFNCSNCSNNWVSANSWAECFQKCRSCSRTVYPKKQKDLRPSGDTSTYKMKPHPQELCQKCMKLGHFCGDQRRIR